MHLINCQLLNTSETLYLKKSIKLFTLQGVVLKVLLKKKWPQGACFIQKGHEDKIQVGFITKTANDDTKENKWSSGNSPPLSCWVHMTSLNLRRLDWQLLTKATAKKHDFAIAVGSVIPSDCITWMLIAFNTRITMFLVAFQLCDCWRRVAQN